MGRTRGGLPTRIHALVRPDCLPVVLKLSEGQGHDGRSARVLLGDLGDGDTPLDDRAYDDQAIRRSVAEQGVRANIKPTTIEQMSPPSVDSSTVTAISRNASRAISNTSAPSHPP